MRSVLALMIATVLPSMPAFGQDPIGLRSDAWASYAQDPDAHPNIPNVSHAGYRGGGVPLPDGTGAAIISVRDFGALGDGAADDTNAVRTAINAAESTAASQAGGVTLLFPEGVYRLSGPLLVREDGIRLAGEGESRTTLLFTESLESSYAVFPGGSRSNWSFTGGMIWFTDASRDSYFSGVPTVSDTGAGFRLSNAASIIRTARLGDRTIRVSNASGFSAGDVVVVQVDNADDLSTLRHLLGDGVWAQNYMFTQSRDGAILPDDRSTWRVYHTIESINGNEVTLVEPLRYDARLEWDPELRTPRDLRREVGLADMTVAMDRDYEWTLDDHNDEPGWNGVFFSDTIDGYVQNVTVLDADGLAVGMNYSKNITVSNVTVAATRPERERQHHAFVIQNSADCLVEDFEVTAWPLHGLYFGNFCVNNVYSRGRMEHGTFDYHRRLPYGNVYTEIAISNDGEAGGSSNAGPRMGARNAHWNIDLGRTSSRLVAQPGITPLGALVNIRCATLIPAESDGNGDPEALIERVGPWVMAAGPRNLYEAQLALRLSDPVDEDTVLPSPCGPCEDDAPYAFDFGGVLGENLIGQDNWVFRRDFSDVDGANTRLERVADHPDDSSSSPVVAAVNRNGRDGVISRQSDDRYAFAPPLSGDRDARARFDAKLGDNGRGAGDAFLIINNGYDEGIQFGMTEDQFRIRGGEFSGTLDEIVPIPGGWYRRGDWARVELRIDFGAGTSGRASLFFLNLSRGESDFRAVPGLQGVDLRGVVQFPESWDRIGFRIRNQAAATNIVPNVHALTELCCGADFDGDGFRTTGDIRQFLALTGGAGFTFGALVDFLRVYDAGCE